MTAVETKPQTTAKVNLLGLTKAQMEAFFTDLGEKAFRGVQVMKWMHQQGMTDFDAMTNLSKPLRAQLNDIAEVRLPEIAFDATAGDGTRKWLFRLDCGNSVETVYIPEAGRATLCVSSQVGCSLACPFCSTGRQGYNRNLETWEIIAQIYLATRLVEVEAVPGRVITNVVFMGMGEPLLNFDNVMCAAQIMMEDNAYGLSKRRVTVSTSGIVPAMRRILDYADVALAISLHAPNDTLRDKLVPINQKYPLKELMAACDEYAPASNAQRSITYEYVLLAGENDSPAHAKELAALLKGRAAKVNLIPFNPFPDSGFEKPSNNRTHAFMREMQSSGIITTVRKTRGNDIDAACGQLVGQVADKSRREAKLKRMNLLD